MQGLKELVRRLDRDTGGDSALRIIPLVHLGANEIVPLLTAVFAGGNGGTAATAPAQAGSSAGPSASSSPPARAPSYAPPLQLPRAVGAEEGGFSTPGFAIPGFAINGGAAPRDSNSARAGNESGGANADVAAAAATGNGAAPPARFVADTRTNTVMVYSSYSIFKLVRERVKALDVPQAQVVIEAMVAEVTLNDSLDRGVEAFLSAMGLDLASSATGGKPALRSGVAGGAFLHAQIGLPGAAQADVILHALQSVTNVKVISTPYLTVVDGKTARLVIGDQVPFATTTVNVTLAGATTTSGQITVRDTGIVLEVTPKIRADNSAVLVVDQSVSNAKTTAAGSDLTPTISTRQVKSEIIVQSGSTILLAGLMQEGSDRTETGVPVARSIPIVGELFKQVLDKASRRELIVLITPRVVRHSSQLENITRQLRGAMRIRE